MNRSNPWDVSASGPPVASGPVPFYNPAQFQPHHSTGSAMASSGATAGHAAGMNMSANYPYQHGLHDDGNNFGAWPHLQGYATAGYDHNYNQQQHPGEPAASLSEGGDVGSYHGELTFDPNWSASQPYEPYSIQFADTSEYDCDRTVVGGYYNVAAGTVDSFSADNSHGAVQLYASHAFKDSGGMSPFIHLGNGVSLDAFPSQGAPQTVAVREEDASEKLPAVNSFSNINYQPSPFDELSDMNLKSSQTGLSEQPVLPSSHSRQSSAGGVVQFLIGGSSSVSESQSRTDSPHALVMEAASGTERDVKDDLKSRNVVTEHAGVTHPHFTDAGSHKNQSGRVGGSPVHSLPPQGTMAGTPASSHPCKAVAGPSTLLEHPRVAPDFTEPPSSDADATKSLPCSTNTELTFPAAGISEDSRSSNQPSHALDDLEMLVKATDDSEYHTSLYAGTLISYPDSSFTPVGNALAMASILSSDFPVSPQGTMAGTPASSHPHKPAAGANTPLEHPHVAPDFAEPPSSDVDATKMWPCSAVSEPVRPEADISEDSQQPSHLVDDFEMLVKAADIYRGPLGSHPGSSFTPVGNASATNAAISPGQRITSSHISAMPHMQAGSVCATADSNTGELDMQEIELDAMVNSGGRPDALHRVEAGSGAKSSGSGTYKQNVHDTSICSHVHHHVKAHRDAVVSPATTLWENPEPVGVQLLAAPAALAESQSTTDRLLSHDLPQNTDAGPSKSGASGVIHETSLDVHSAKRLADQLVPQTPLASSVLLQNSRAFTLDNSLSPQLACESTEQPIVQPATDLGTSSVVQSESVDPRSISCYSRASSNVPLNPLHVAITQMSEKLPAAPAGDMVAGHNVIMGPDESPQLRPSVGSEVEHTHVNETRQMQNAGEQIGMHPADQGQHCDIKNSQQNVHGMQSKNNSICQHVPQRGSGDVQSLLQKSHNLGLQEAHREVDDTVHAVESKQQRLPTSLSDVPDERDRASRYRAEVDRPRSRQGDMDLGGRRPWSRQGYDNRPYDRPRSSQDYYDWGYGRPHSRPRYDYAHGYEQPQSRQICEDPRGRPRPMQGYEDPHCYQPRSRQGYKDWHDMLCSEHNHPGEGQQHRPDYEDRHDRPSSRQSYHEPVDRPGSRQEYDSRPRSHHGYEDWSGSGGAGGGGREHEPAGTCHNNRYSSWNSYDRPGSQQDLIDKRHDTRQAHRYPAESFDRSRYTTVDERHERMSWHDNPDELTDPRYRASHGYREEEHRRPRSRGGEIFAHVTHIHTHTHPFNGPLSGTTQVSRHQKGKTNLDFTEARDSEWQWQVCTSFQTDNHANTSPLSFLQAGCPSCRPTNSVRH